MPAGLSSKTTLAAGCVSRLGATPDADGVNFALFSAHAEAVELCLFSKDGRREIARHQLAGCRDQIWHGYLPGAGSVTVYGYHVHGPWQPQMGHRFNANKLLLDPYSRLLSGEFEWHPAHDAQQEDAGSGQCLLDPSDNQQWMPKSVVVADNIATSRWQPRVAMRDMVIYEAHVKGLTRLHPDLSKAEQGRLAGLANKKVLAYIKALGITSIELMPIQSFISERFLVQRGLHNYWGYNPLSLFAPHNGYLQRRFPEHNPEQVLAEVRDCVRACHDAGLEVIMDVVCNHTAEGGRLGPNLSMRGIDNLSYYRLQHEDRSYYINDSGCGNTLNLQHSRVIQLVMDSLRYWVQVMEVDGFRFDLATVLGRDEKCYDPGAGMFDAMLQDPVLAPTKLIAEPWDIGPGGYQLGNFPPRWSEWNDRYRDTMRRFWRGDKGMLPEFARRLHGSSDLFEHKGRLATASINYISSHDGFTLNDLVSYRERYNQANGENNQDGHRENFSDNYGIEGATDDPEVQSLRLRQQRNMLMTLMMSQGVPMLQAGDELCRSLGGNNNAYCQDNATNWIDWTALETPARGHQHLVRRLLAVRREYQVLFPERYMHDGQPRSAPCITWFNADGAPMRAERWHERNARTLICLLSHDSGPDYPRHLLLLVHAGREALTLTLPTVADVGCWQLLLDSCSDDGEGDSSRYAPGNSLQLPPCSTLVLVTENATNEGELHE